MKSTWESYRLFHEGQLALSRASSNGIRIDTGYLKNQITQVDAKIADLEKRLAGDKITGLWRSTFGMKAKLTSPIQLGEIIFGKLGYPCPERTATGRYKTEETAFEKVDLPFVKDWIEVKSLKRVKKVYLEGILDEVIDGYIHPSFHLNTARSLRSSSSAPNFQNIPVRDPIIAKMIRPAFIPRPGRAIVENDFSGAEVRISACYHQDPMMVRYIKDPTTDMHRDLACELYFLEPAEVTKMTRYAAKSYFTFAQFYGDWFIHCAKNLWESIDKHKLTTVSGESLRKHLKKNGIRALGDLDPSTESKPGTFERHVRDVERHFWGERFKVYADWKNSWYEDYLACGGFRLLTGFWVEGVYSKNDVTNYPIQGTSFHCLLWCFTKMQEWIDRHGMDALLIGQIHDSMIADVPEEEVQDYLNAVEWTVSKGLLKHWPWIIVPMEVEAEVAQGNWHEKKQWIKGGETWRLKD